MVSERTPKSFPFTLSRAYLITPGPDTPTLMTLSVSVTPWKAPAINGLSSGALQNTTSFAHPILSLSFVRKAVSLIILPIRATASIFIPVFVEPRFTEAQTFSVSESAFGIDLIKSSSLFVMPFAGSAEKPPRKFTPTFCAASSKVFAIFT